jgi:four helix bundle protein
MTDFDYEKLDVYQASIKFVIVADKVIEHFPKGKAYLADQLQRAATSISLNIAEGAGEFSRSDKARFYRFARRSTTECGAIFDVCKNLNAIDLNLYAEGRSLLKRIIEMLTKLVNNLA